MLKSTSLAGCVLCVLVCIGLIRPGEVSASKGWLRGGACCELTSCSVKSKDCDSACSEDTYEGDLTYVQQSGGDQILKDNGNCGSGTTGGRQCSWFVGKECSYDCTK
ncbi:MAG: hypothetical protein ABFD69_08335 [Candidatus Sumerlaeia bacterium]